MMRLWENNSYLPAYPLDEAFLFIYSTRSCPVGSGFSLFLSRTNLSKCGNQNFKLSEPISPIFAILSL